MQTTTKLDKRAALANHFLFAYLEPSELDRLLGLGVERHFADGQAIFRKGDPGKSMMAVLLGLVRISVMSEEGKELILSLIPAGCCIGEIALLDGKERTADATAIGDCILFEITRHDFLPFLERTPKVAIRLLIVLGERLRSTDEFVENLAFLNLPTRLSRLLLKLTKTHGIKTAAGLRISLKLSQQDLGNLIATSRESVNKQLRAWQANGLITLEKESITILKLDALKKVADSVF